MSESNPPSTRKTKQDFQQWIPWLMAALVAWGALLGLGAYLYGDKHRELRGLIVFACALVFVLFWWVALTFRRPTKEIR